MKRVLWIIVGSLWFIVAHADPATKHCDDQAPPYWAFTTGKEWKYEPGNELDRILHSTIELKEKYKNEIQIIIRHPETKCVIGQGDPRPKVAQLYIVVTSQNQEIANRLEALGMTYQQ